MTSPKTPSNSNFLWGVWTGPRFCSAWTATAALCAHGHQSRWFRLTLTWLWWANTFWVTRVSMCCFIRFQGRTGMTSIAWIRSNLLCQIEHPSAMVNLKTVSLVLQANREFSSAQQSPWKVGLLLRNKQVQIQARNILAKLNSTQHKRHIFCFLPDPRGYVTWGDADPRM